MLFVHETLSSPSASVWATIGRMYVKSNGKIFFGGRQDVGNGRSVTNARETIMFSIFLWYTRNSFANYERHSAFHAVLDKAKTMIVGKCWKKYGFKRAHAMTYST